MPVVTSLCHTKHMHMCVFEYVLQRYSTEKPISIKGEEQEERVHASHVKW